MLRYKFHERISKFALNLCSISRATGTIASAIAAFSPARQLARAEQNSPELLGLKTKTQTPSDTLKNRTSPSPQVYTARKTPGNTYRRYSIYLQLVPLVADLAVPSPVSPQLVGQPLLVLLLVGERLPLVLPHLVTGTRRALRIRPKRVASAGRNNHESSIPFSI